MALSTGESDFISKSSDAAKALLDLYGLLSQLDALWAGSPSYKTTITQADIDGVASFNETGLTTASGGTTGTLPDGEFALATIKNQITSSLTALSILANLP